MRASAVILVLWAAVLLPGTFLRGYWDPDEARYGAVARETWRGDGGVVPHLNGEPYAEKPPLGFWLMAGAQMLSGGTSAPASRLPSMLATGITALLLLSLARRSHGAAAGTVAAAAFLTAPLVVQMGIWVGLDALATLFVTLAVFAQVRSLAPGARATAWRVLLYASLAATVLVKGVPFLIAVVALAAHAWLRGGWRALFPRHLLWGVPLLLALVGAWAGPAVGESGPGYLRGLTLEQVERRVVDGTSHVQPIGYYLETFPLFFLPWTLLLPAIVVAARREVRGGPDRRRPGRVETGRHLLWFFVCLVAFSLIPGKRERYILALYVPAAALAGIAYSHYRDSRGARSLLGICLWTGLGLAGLSALGFGVCAVFFGRLFGDRLAFLPAGQGEEIVRTVHAGAPIAVLGTVSVLLVIVEAFFRRRSGPPVAPLAAAAAFLVFAVSVVGLPALDRAKSYAPLVDGARSRAPEEARWGVLDLQPGPFCLELDTDGLVTFAGGQRRGQAARRLAEDPALVLFMTEDDAREIEARIGVPLATLARRRVGHRDLVAVRGR